MDMEKHVIEHIQNSIDEVFGFEFFQGITNSCSSKMEQYLQMLIKIKEFVFKILESYISKTSQNANSVLELKEIKRMLNYKDFRSVSKWCDKNDVFVYSQGNAQIVNKAEFLLAFHKPFIIHLQRTKKNWQDLFEQYVNGNLGGLVEATEQKNSVRYKPKTQIEKSFLNKIKGL